MDLEVLPVEVVGSQSYAALLPRSSIHNLVGSLRKHEWLQDAKASLLVGHAGQEQTYIPKHAPQRSPDFSAFTRVSILRQPDISLTHVVLCPGSGASDCRIKAIVVGGNVNFPMHIIPSDGRAE
jgi:hypothetical protein